MMMSKTRARAIAISRKENDSALYAFRLSLIAVGAVAALLTLLF